MIPPAAASVPKYVEVSEAIEAQMRDGRWDGEKMPSVRGIALTHRVSIVTASRALQVLRDKGLIQTIERSGTFRKPPPTAERWAVCLRLTPGPWQRATISMSRVGFEALARRQSMNLEFDRFPADPALAAAGVLEQVREAKAGGVQGVFLLPSRVSDEDMREDERLLAACEAEGLPVVLLERNLRGAHRELTHDLVTLDDLGGAAQCTRHLLDLGRKRVAIVVASPSSSHNGRVAGYLYALHDAARTHAGKKAPEYNPVVLYQDSRLDTKDAYARLADQIKQYKVDGILCYQDYTAIGLILELLNRGVAVPKEVAVVGFDDLPIGNLFTIGVTTYGYPSEGMAEQAVRLMRERIQDPARPPVKVVVPGRLIVRESTVAGAKGS